MEESSVSFGAWVARLRRAEDLTQHALAQRVGCSVSALRKIEADERRPSREVAELLARALGVPAEQQPLFLRVARREVMVERLPAPEEVAAAAYRSTLGLAGGTPPESPVAGSSTSAVPPNAGPQADGQPRLVHEEALASMKVFGSPAAGALPLPTTPLVGRDAELATLLALFGQPACRLVTLVGPGGIGKTRLALQAASILRERGAPVVFVALTSLQAAEQLAQIVASALGVAAAGASAGDALGAWLAPRAQVLVLDSMEHLLEGAGLLSQLLEQAPGLRLLVTSRERLNLQGEWVLEVHGLPVPPLPTPLQAGGAGAGLEGFSAVQLFLHSAQRARVGFAPTSEDLAAIARICRLVDGMPLAIELAAGWVRILSCAEIADEIERDLHFLASQARDVPARHRSIASLFDQSWALLEERERQVLSRLSVFRAGFTREMAERVAGATLPVLSSLVAHSLVRRTGDQRYDLHELVRQYAFDRLRTSGALPTIERALVATIRSLVRTARPEMIGPQQTAWLDRLTLELNNLRAALDWCHHAGEIAIGLEMAAGLAAYWYQRDAQREGVRRIGSFLEAVDELEGDPATPRPAGSEVLQPHALIDALNGYGYLAYELGAFTAARDRLEQALGLLQQTPNSQLEGVVLNTLGQVLAGMGDLDGARTVLERALALAPDDSYAQRRRALSLMALADVQSLAGENERAQFLYAASASVWRESGDRNALAYALRKWGWSALYSNDLDEAQRLAVESLELNLVTGSHIGILASVVCVGAVLLAQGEVAEAARLLFAAEAILERTHTRLRPGDQTGHQAALASLRAHWGEPEAATLAAAAQKLTLEEVVSLALPSK
jgi:predicted ATPase/transcriptional regulator with XRE-family HTH domain